MRYPISGIILAGGKSQRMGRNKALIEIDGLPIIERTSNIFRSLFEETLVISDDKELFAHLGVSLYGDIFPGRGALGGLYTGLFYSSFPFAFCVACDMPFLKATVIEYMISLRDQYDVVVPKTEDGFHPLHAIYSKRCLDPIRQILDEKKNKIIELYPYVSVKIVTHQELQHLDPGYESFININTPNDLLKLEQKRAIH